MFWKRDVKKRVKNFSKYLKDTGLKKVIIYNKTNIRYFIGEIPPEFSILVFEEYKPVLYVGRLDFELAKKLCNFCEIREFKGWKYVLKDVDGIEKDFPAYFTKKLKGVVFVSEKIEELRSIKSKKEIKRVEKAIKISEKSLENVLNSIENKRKVKEIDVKKMLECEMLYGGAEKSAFETIVLSGKNTSFPHGISGNKKIKDILLIDFGAVFNGYNSDITRTYILKKDKRFVEVYNTVKNSKEAVEDYIKDGISVKDLDIFARKEMGKFSQYFIHALGHGVGLDVHEIPTISKGSSFVLKKNMIITIEPGIYLKNKFGVRIEDMYLVKRNGYKKLTKIEIPEY